MAVAEAVPLSPRCSLGRSSSVLGAGAGDWSDFRASSVVAGCHFPNAVHIPTLEALLMVT